MIDYSTKISRVTMILSYIAMIIGLFLWDGGTIIFFSIFTFGMPLIILAMPLFAITMTYAKSVISLFLRFLCGFLILIPFFVALTSLPFKIMVDESGCYKITPHGTSIALLIFVSSILFLLGSIDIFMVRHYELNYKYNS